jgi:hypothetical protein
MKEKDCDDLVHHILEAARNIVANPNNWLMSGTPFDAATKHSCQPERYISSLLVNKYVYTVLEGSARYTITH